MSKSDVIPKWVLSNLPPIQIFANLRYWYYQKRLAYSGGFFWSETGLEIIHPENIAIGSGCTFMKNVTLNCCGTKDNPNPKAVNSYLRIGNNCYIHPNVLIIAGTHNWNKGKTDEFIRADTLIGHNVHILPNAIIFPGVTIEDNALIGTGSIVTHDIPENVIAYGEPCKEIRGRQ